MRGIVARSLSSEVPVVGRGAVVVGEQNVGAGYPM